ncbi:MAG: hypothetical protein C4308_14760 [Chitinophagaceae bacterium]
MVGLKDFIKPINEALKVAFDDVFDFKKYKVFDLAINAQKNDTDQIFPVAFTKNGKGKYLGADDIQSIITYHKVNNFTVSRESRLGYGDSRGRIKNTYNMKLIVFLKRDITKVEPDELALYIQNKLPECTSSTNGIRLVYNIGEVILNDRQVFDMEYKNVPYFVKPEHALMAINYTIESTFDTNCFNLIPYEE